MPKAVWNNQIIAEATANDIQRLEGNVYFPITSVKFEFLRSSDSHTTCSWKGIASYYDVLVGHEVNEDAAWYYPDPFRKAIHIKDHIAFWHGVQVEE